MAQLLGNVAVGSTVYLNENGSPQPYLVVHQGLPSSLYDESCNGTWLLRQNIILNNQWSLSVNAYASSSVVVLLQNYVSYDPLFSEDIISVIKTVKIPYYVGGGFNEIRSGANGYTCKLFLLGGYEVGLTTSDNAYLPKDGAKLSYFISGTGTSATNKRIAKLNGQNDDWWTRSPHTGNSTAVKFVNNIGGLGTESAKVSNGIRPAMVMPPNLIVDDSDNITVEQVSSITTLTTPSVAMQGQSIPLSWTPVSVSGFDVTYQLQRNVNDGGWQNVGTPISQTSYTDTAQSGWTQVQYQVAPVIEGGIGNYTQSSIIPVSDPSVLVISGSDGNLGTLTSNVPYTVSSNTGNPISLTRTVNNAQVVTLTVESGFAYNIPIADLPTGTGTIQIIASVEDTGQQIQTQTRTWTYYKTPIDIPSTGGIAQLTQNGQNIWPVTVPDAVEAPVYLGGNLNAALNKLGQAALYTKIGSPKYNQVTVDLSKVSVGDEVLLPENGVMVPFYVGSLNYEPTLNTSGNRVFLFRKDTMGTKQKWNNTAINSWPNSSILNWLNNDYKDLLDSEVQNSILSTTYYYTPGNGSNNVTTRSDDIFLLSLTELRGNNDNANIEGTPFTEFAFSKLYTSITQWTRSPGITNTISAMSMNEDGGVLPSGVTSQYGVRPCFTLPATFNQTYYVDSSNNIHPSQEYTQGGSITDVFGYGVPICQYETGSYVGTGTINPGGANSLTFNFNPKIIFIAPSSQTVSTSLFQSIAFIQGCHFVISVGNQATTTTNPLYLTWSNNSVSWYSTLNAMAQLNNSGTTYNYIAIG